MKKLIISLVLLNSIPTFANVDLGKLAASWKMFCTQSQSSGKQGFMIETYTFTKTGSFQLDRQWFKDAGCKTKTEIESESGSIEIGKENTNNGFNPVGTYEAQYKTEKGNELGLIWVDGSYSKLRLARGFGQFQNTMLGVFEYKKQ
jgi:hypothetical protein